MGVTKTFYYATLAMEAFHSPLDCVEPNLFVALERSVNTTHLNLQACLIKETKFGFLLKL